MSNRTFTWENFSYDFLKNVIYGPKTPEYLKPRIIYSEKEYEHLIPFMNRICVSPDDTFVRRYRTVIEDYLLNGSGYLVDVVKRLEKLNYGGIRLTNNDDMLLALKNKNTTQTLCDVYRSIIMRIGKSICEDDSVFKFPKTIDLTNAGYDDVPLYPYQEKAVDAMQKYFVDEDGMGGILSMPTGSGKTRTGVYYLLRNMVSRGYQVIWLCHRSMLIEQAAEQFYRFAPLIKAGNNNMEKFKMVCISGKHANVRALEKDDNLIISSVQSLCNNTEFLSEVLAEKVIMVVDEAHHTLAPTYRRIIKVVREHRPNAKLLGLTATPVRLTEKATKQLMTIFDNKIVFSVPMSDLIADGTLANPVYIPRDTNIDIEAFIDVDERKYIQKWGELPESLVNKVAKTNERNEFIVKEYVDNKDKYGKTIIFALNAIHCDSLNEALKKKGIRSSFVYSLNGDAENNLTIEKFKNNELDVLININILTEGSDFPDVQTVFLTRPTTSDVLLMQMVGRGMRGTGCGGTKEVNIVDFCDKWSSITGWMNPQFLLDKVPIENEEIEYKKYEFILIPFDAIRDIVKGISYKAEFGDVRESTLPLGWYDVYNDDGNDVKVLVFDNQLNGFNNLKEEYEQFIDNDASAKSVIKKYFRSFEMIPTEEDMASILRYIRQEKEYPELHSFEVRDAIEPFEISNRIKNGNLTYHDTIKLIDDTFEQNSEVILSIYGSFDYYKKRITDCMMFPDGKVPVGSIIEEADKEYYKLSTETISESIEDLLSEVMTEQKELLGDSFIRPDITWTERPMSAYYGIYYPNENYIHINSLLNSVSVPKEVIKFVIYHECLHQEIRKHGKEFREKERKYPNFAEHEHFLDYTLRDFEM